MIATRPVNRPFVFMFAAARVTPLAQAYHYVGVTEVLGSPVRDAPR
jgi:hypothetical protein